MSVQSMTGYGKAEAIGEGYSVTVEFKSVNNRFLEFQIRTSKNILHLEPKLKQSLESTSRAAAYHVTFNYDSTGPAGSGLALNRISVRRLPAVIRDAQKRLGVGTVLDIADLLKIPDMITAAETSEPVELVAERIMPVFTRACLELVAMREKEGDVLAADLQDEFAPSFPDSPRLRS